MQYTYIEAISKAFIGVQCSAPGDGNIYEEILWEGGTALPSKITLDEWIAANPKDETHNGIITVLAFRSRLTQTERVTLELASIDNPSATMQARQMAAMLRVMAHDLSVATYVDLTRADTIAGTTALETYGIIGTGRAAQILDTSNIQDFERPKSHVYD